MCAWNFIVSVTLPSSLHVTITNSHKSSVWKLFSYFHGWESWNWNLILNSVSGVSSLKHEFGFECFKVTKVLQPGTASYFAGGVYLFSPGVMWVTLRLLVKEKVESSLLFRGWLLGSSQDPVPWTPCLSGLRSLSVEKSVLCVGSWSVRKMVTWR